MSSENRITATIFITLIFGIFSSALVNGITDSQGVRWLSVFWHRELYVLVLLGFSIIYLAKKTARESTEQWVFFKEKLEAIQIQGFLGGVPAQNMPATVSVIPQTQPQPRLLEFTDNAKKALASQNKNIESKILSVMYWLKYASASEIVMRNDIRKLHSSNATEFLLRIGGLRIVVDIDLQQGKLLVRDILRKEIT
jgi:hypothetical protein